ncbi:MAG: coproporphyrinogen III oxidase family protein [Bacteriovoracaceae bacterium]|nr:coproporphyrinogen III oxidase family protein [Bacteriovoracaceae bacterium]
MPTIKSLYLHFPFCAHLCNYCDFFKSVPQNKDTDFQNFAHYLEQCNQVHSQMLQKYSYEYVPFETFYIGGGTPSLWSTTGALALKDFFENHNWKLAKDCEATLEVNPGGWTRAGLDAFRAFGMNRFSLGIQSLNEKFLKVLDRYHDLNHVHETLNYFNEHELNFSVDFMLGLPFSREYKRDVIAELEEILKYQPKHLSLYILTIKSNYIHKDHMPDDEWIEAEYLKVADYLEKNGYVHYEVSNFSKPGFESKHNLRYWDAETVAALGPSATGFLKEQKLRYKWKPYKYEFEEEVLTESEMEFEKIYLNLRCFKGLDTDQYFTTLTAEKIQAWQNLIQKWETMGYLQSRNPVILNSKGFLIMDSLMDDLFKKDLV